jgi:Malectin domain
MRLVLSLFVAWTCQAQVHINACTPGDSDFTGGTCYTSPIALPAGAPLYLQQERYGNFSYHFPMADGSYTVVLHFIENSVAITAPGQRQFTVTLNGTAVITNLDLAAVAALNTPVDRSFPVTASGGAGISIVFSTVIRNAVVSALDITPVVSAPSGFPGCLSDGNKGIACTGGFQSGAGTTYDPTMAWGGITYRLPSGDGTGKNLGDAGIVPCGNIDPSVLATNPTCHQFVWR